MHHTKYYIRQLLVDVSASMDIHQDALTDILNEHTGEFLRFVDRHPEATHLFGLSTFTSECSPVFELVIPDVVRNITNLEVTTGGETALFDACWHQLDALENRMRAQGIDFSAHVDFHLISDGVDTASTAVRFADLRQRMEVLQSTGRWTFHFHEADLDTIELNALLGLKRQLSETADPRQLRAALVEFLTPGKPKSEDGPLGN